MDNERTADVLQVALASYDRKELRVQKNYLEEQNPVLACTCFLNGHKLLQELQQGHNFDIVVLCSQMEDMSSIEFMMELRKLEHKPLLMLFDEGRRKNSSALRMEDSGSCCCVERMELKNLLSPELAGILFQLAVRVQKATGVHIGYINLSGGVGIPYRPEQTENDIMAIGEGVRKKFEEILVPAGMGDVAIFTEMGRFTTGPYGALVATAIHEKHIYKEYIGLDACAANLMRPAMYGAYHHITVLGKENEPCDHMYDVVGGLCENNDKFAIDRMLPKIDIGDIVYIHDTGAHGSAMGYNYNGKLRSAEVLLCEDGTHRLIRRAETPRDYFATLDFLPLMKPLFED